MGRKKQTVLPKPTADHPMPEMALTALQKLKQRLLDTFDMMELFHLSRNTLYNLRKAKKLAFTKIGRRIYYFVEDVLLFLQNNKQLGLH